MMSRFHQLLFIYIGTFTLFSCSQTKEEADFSPYGPWTLESRVYTDGTKQDYPCPCHNNGWLRVYDDSCFYQCCITQAPNGTLVTPDRTEKYTLVKKGPKGFIYLQEDGTHPFVVENDSTIIIQEDGIQYRWKRSHDLEQDKVNAIVNVIKNYADDNEANSHQYVFSNVERELQTSNHTLIYVLLFVICALVTILNYSYNLRKNKRRVEQELKQIEQERQAIPEQVREALNSVEEEFHRSDFYNSIHTKLNDKKALTNDDWKQIEENCKRVYPRFTSTLSKLCEMSKIELQVCLLLKLNATPSEIANVLHKETSSISSIRIRLYMKVFSKKGSSKDWDNFIHSL